MNFHESMMSIAIDIAKKGKGNVSPNPLPWIVITPETVSLVPKPSSDQPSFRFIVTPCSASQNA